MSNQGKNVSVHYRGTFDDGTEFDSSYSRNQPLDFVCGAGQMIPGFDKAVIDMEVGQTVNIRLEPAEAYGESRPELIMQVPLEQAQGLEDAPLGVMLVITDGYGRQHQATLVGRDQQSVTLDLNHEMAGKTLNFEITLLSAE